MFYVDNRLYQYHFRCNVKSHKIQKCSRFFLRSWLRILNIFYLFPYMAWRQRMNARWGAGRHHTSSHISHVDKNLFFPLCVFGIFLNISAFFMPSSLMHTHTNGKFNLIILIYEKRYCVSFRICFELKIFTAREFLSFSLFNFH